MCASRPAARRTTRCEGLGTTRLCYVLGMRLLGILLLSTCAMHAQTPASAPDLKSASGYPKMVQKQVSAWIERAAEKMPEEEYAFKPDPAVRSFAQILGHVADANNSFCAGALGESIQPPAIEKTKTTKAELKAALHEAFAYCNRAYDALTDASANETVKAFGQERNKLGVLWFNSSHNLEHYGNLVVYMRVKGIVPPSSDKP
jgi:uncharacterized damage-inducible protein DinB